MHKWVPALIPTLVAGVFANQAIAGEINLKVNIPQINTAEYHRPYVAIWIEKPDQSVEKNLAVWYSQKKATNGDEGTKWLKDLRQWWRKSGRDQFMPLDGVSGATRPVGEQTLNFTEGKEPLGTLPAGEYNLVVEAAREKGNREMIRIPFTWPVQKIDRAKGVGQQELGDVILELKP
ncbi:MAG: DUF2271 domain-containing protein [Methylophilaceae bacterium]|uniref:DUF2271 domain-containing protein n=1 Tax=Methylovorus sp. MM2 TaxID=1848038 RepID=UPI0007DFD06C|nr:DUF2271 domain-containing protein [Methylovorus sp. MM2]OAM51598.1 hypothetical protein A7981_08955 [Methylovorus sp. MM2]